MSTDLSRRDMILRTGACFGAAAVGTPVSAAGVSQAQSTSEPFGYSLNMATIMGQKLSIVEEIEVAAQAGWQGVEPWLRNINRYVEGGGSLGDLRKRIGDLGLSVVSAIGFTRWAVDDEEERAKGVEQFKAEMDLIAQIGGHHIAAAPAGISGNPDIDLRKVAERYRTLLELGRQTGVRPQLEIWGSARTLGTVGQAALVACQADHADACLLLDAYHMYKGGSGFECLRLLSGAQMHAFHVNDYPADPPREEINDSHRVYPGDGVCPLSAVLGSLHASGFRGMLSLEVFNRDYWQQDPLTVAKTGLEKTRAAVRRAMGQEQP
ncbi:MAG: sugar phosphate isomerase/epimerase [Planctomycetes bacterium]|nr:sugar phosphate isomerase/epimerase [Planctomycetota bacterium]